MDQNEIRADGNVVEIAGSYNVLSNNVIHSVGEDETDVRRQLGVAVVAFSGLSEQGDESQEVLGEYNMVMGNTIVGYGSGKLNGIHYRKGLGEGHVVMDTAILGVGTAIRAVKAQVDVLSLIHI